MPITQWVEKERRRVRLDAWDRVTLPEVRSAIDAVLRDPDYEPGFAFLVDPSRLSVPPTGRQTRGITAHLERAGPVVAGSRWAVVAPTPACYGVTRMLGALVEPVPITVMGFPTLVEAERWLTEPGPSSSSPAPTTAPRS